MKTPKQSNKTKIIVIIMFLLTILLCTSVFTDILERNPLYEGGFLACNLGWMVSMYFDGKSQKNKDS